MSFAKTLAQFNARTKTVTRRDGWWDEEKNEPRVKRGDIITGIQKGMGLQKGERQVVLHDIEVLNARREELGAITPEDVAREGFPGWTCEQFISFYGRPSDHQVTRIEFRHLDDDANSLKQETT
jgi:hypothetical protein